MYLWGQPFLLRTDHGALVWLRRFKNPEGIVGRWISKLQEFDFEMQHRAGHKHGNADAMSSRPRRACKRTECVHCQKHDLVVDEPASLLDEESCSTTIGIIIRDENVGEFYSDDLRKQLQADEAMKAFMESKRDNMKPDKKVVVKYGQEFASLLQQWDVLQVVDGILYRRIKI
jgi:hypothetical protein